MRGRAIRALRLRADGYRQPVCPLSESGQHRSRAWAAAPFNFHPFNNKTHCNLAPCSFRGCFFHIL